MTTPFEDSVLINATIGNLTTVPIGLPTDGNFGSSPAQPGYPNANAPVQIIPNISSNTTAPDIIDAIVSYLQQNSSLNLTRPNENLNSLTMSNIYQARQANTGNLVNMIPFNDLINTNLITPINISVNGGDKIRCKINNVNYGEVTLPSYYPQQIMLITEDTSNSNNFLFINIKDPYRNNSSGTSYILTIAEVYIKNSANVISLLNATSLNTFQIEIIPSPSMGLTNRLSNLLEFYIDEDTSGPLPNAYINGIGLGIITPSPITTVYVSGIQTLVSGEVLSINYEVDNVIYNYYKNEYVGRLYPQNGNNFVSVFNTSTTSVPPGFNSFSNNITLINENEDINCLVVIVAQAMTSYNSFANDFYTRNIYYDTKSLNYNNNLMIGEYRNLDVDFNGRIKSKVGLFPTYSNDELSHFHVNTLRFDSQLTLDNTVKVDGTGYELQLRNGKYMYPADTIPSPYNDATTIYPVKAGGSFSYNGLNGDPATPGSDYRWATFVINGNDISKPYIKNRNSLVLTINNPENLTGLVTAPSGINLIKNMLIYMKFVDIVGSTGVPSNNCGYSQNGIFTATPNGSVWFDCNKESTLATPTADGDAIVDGSGTGIQNTLSQKKLSFGTRSYTGRIIVRVGIASGSNIKFTGISF